MESLVPECWRDVIVAGRSRKSSASFGTPAIVSLREPAAVHPPIGRAGTFPRLFGRYLRKSVLKILPVEAEMASEYLQGKRRSRAYAVLCSSLKHAAVFISRHV